MASTTLHHDADASASFARFAYDVHCVAHVSNRYLPADRLLTAYARALYCRPGEPNASKTWITFYMWLECFTRNALRSIEPREMPSVLASLLRFEEILDDDFGSQLFPPTQRSYGTAVTRN